MINVNINRQLFVGKKIVCCSYTAHVRKKTKYWNQHQGTSNLYVVFNNQNILLVSLLVWLSRNFRKTSFQHKTFMSLYIELLKKERDFCRK